MEKPLFYLTNRDTSCLPPELLCFKSINENDCNEEIKQSHGVAWLILKLFGQLEIVGHRP
jgi:hypothetical protein